MHATPLPVTRSTTGSAQAWRLQDAKSQFSALVDNAMRGVPQHVTRRGKQAVVVLSEQDFEALKRGAANRAARPASFIEHLLAMPTEPPGTSPKTSSATGSQTHVNPPARKPAVTSRPDLQPREIDWS